MESRREKAIELFKKGYNCSQSVVLAYVDVLGLDWDQAAKMSASFGGGLGRLRHVCGTVSGMAMVAGMITASSDPEDKEQKKGLRNRTAVLSAGNCWDWMEERPRCQKNTGQGQFLNREVPNITKRDPARNWWGRHVKFWIMYCLTRRTKENLD